MANDGYAGAVTPGGSSDVRELPRLTIRKCSVSSFDNNAYLLTCRSTGAQLLVDAAADPDRLRALLEEGTERLDVIVTTHQHQDHVGALREMARTTGARTAAGAEDADGLPVAVDDRLSHGDTVTFGEVTLDVVALRGHTPGSVALAYRDPSDPEGFTSPLHGRLTLSGRGRQHQEPGPELRVAVPRRHRASVRRLRRRHLGLPGARERHDPRGGAAAPRRVARPRLVTARSVRAVRAPGASRAP